MKQRVALLVFWIAATVFPFGWVGNFSRRYADVFNWVFATETAHFIMHSALYFGLMVLLALTTGAHHMNGTMHAKTRRLLVLFVIVVLIAGAQEYFQLLYKQRPFGDAEIFDIATDICAAGLGLVAMWGFDGLVHRRRAMAVIPPRDPSAE